MKKYAFSAFCAALTVFLAVGCGFKNTNKTDAAHKFQDKIIFSPEVVDEFYFPDSIIVLTFTGDTTLGQSLTSTGMNFEWQYNQVKDPKYFLKNMYPLFKADDLTILNFEGTITENSDGIAKPFRFKGPKKYLEILTSSSVEMVNLANNHTYDFGLKGYKDTQAALDEAGIEYFGLEKVVIKKVKGRTLCFHGVKGWDYQRESKMLKEHFETFGSECDFITTTIHGGEEREYVHNALQEKLAKLAVDHGSDLVIGHHAHVVQDKQIYKGVPIYYGLGNFLFGGNKNPPDKNALVVRVFIKGKKIAAVEEIPISISSVKDRNNYQPTIKEK
ncbi:poly-gamma-glutamate synthesis protein (capsule biosynthesis protein) [Parelusimicrobium proximum]|uniref:CapA family protein n=1 Tax=Parelusimicrobium proximum TaxID=3228953 RepID=UPI003D17CDFB